MKKGTGQKPGPLFHECGSDRIKENMKKGRGSLPKQLFSLRQTALETSLGAIKNCSPELLVRRYFTTAIRIGGLPCSFSETTEIFLLSIGKAALPMAKAAGETLGWEKIKGLVVSRRGQENWQAPITLDVIRAGHPYPDENSVLAGKTAIGKLEALKTGVPVLFLVSGGASSLFEFPQEGVTLECLRGLTGKLLHSGASIEEINKVRVALSKVKGGRLLDAAGNRDSLTLILSDVVGDKMEAIGSGPTVPSSCNAAREAIEVLGRYRLWSILDSKMKALLERESESWKRDKKFPGASHEIVGNNRLLCETAIEELKKRGFNTLFLGSTISGEAREIGRLMADLAKEILVSGNPVPKPAAIVSGGETVVSFNRDAGGIGGPNQEVALSFAIQGADLPGTVLVSIDTDGFDGPTPYAGGLADGQTWGRIQACGRDAREDLEQHNSAKALDAASALVVTGSTESNLNDLRILLVGDPDLRKIAGREGENDEA